MVFGRRYGFQITPERIDASIVTGYEDRRLTVTEVSEARESILANCNRIKGFARSMHRFDAATQESETVWMLKL